MFYFNEGSLNLPEGWQDRSITLLAHPSNLSISIARDDFPAGMTFEEYVQSQFTMASQQLKEYRELERKTETIDRREAIISQFEWTSPQGKMHQISVIINLPVRPIVITVSSLAALTEGQTGYLLDIIRSFRARSATE